MRKNLSLNDALTAEEFANGVSMLSNFSDLIKRFVVSMSNEDRQGVRTIAEGREGYAAEALRVSRLFENELPRSFDINEFDQLFKLYNDWKGLKTQAEMIAEQIDDTVLALGIEIMKKTDRVNSLLQIARNENANLDRALEGLDNFNRRYSNRTNNSGSASSDTPPSTDTVA